jgi:polar amino acid transport system permease protein
MRFEFLGSFAGVLAQATLLTIGLSAAALVGGGLIGALIALARLLGGKPTERLLTLPIDLVRGTPLLVQLMIWYLVPGVLRWEISPFEAAALGLSVNAGAFISEILRGGIAAVPRGQREAALALGLSRTYSVFGIELPQALPAIVPALIGFYIGLIKDTSLAYIVGLHELTRQAKLIADFTFRPLEIYLVIAVLYFALCFPLSRLVPLIERRLRRSGAVQARLPSLDQGRPVAAP